MDAKGSLAAAYDQPPFAFEPRRVPGSGELFGMAMNTEDSLREYLRLFVRIPFVGRIGPLARTFDFVADAAPGVKEILSLGKLCYEVRERHYDIVVVDAEASGHIVSQIDAPRAITDLVKVGLIRDQTRWMLELLDDPAVTGLAVVTTPEEMPVNESVELIERVRTETRVDIAAVIVNRMLPDVLDERGRDVFARLQRPGVQALLTEAAGPKVADRPRRDGSGARPPRSRSRPRRGARRADRWRHPAAAGARALHPGDRPAGRAAGGRAPGGWRLMPALDELLAAKEMVVVCGSGGVGKTTTAATLGAMAATHLGGKVLVLTVDPARRLANALGLEAFGNAERRIDLGAVGPAARVASSGRRCSTRRRDGTT